MSVFNWLWKLQGLSCREALRLSAQAMDGPIPMRTRAALLLHGWLCRYCHNYQRQIRLLRKWLRMADAPGSAATKSGLSPEAARRIKDALRGQ